MNECGGAFLIVRAGAETRLPTCCDRGTNREEDRCLTSYIVYSKYGCNMFTEVNFTIKCSREKSRLLPYQTGRAVQVSELDRQKYIYFIKQLPYICFSFNIINMHQKLQHLKHITIECIVSTAPIENIFSLFLAFSCI